MPGAGQTISPTAPERVSGRTRDGHEAPRREVPPGARGAYDLSGTLSPGPDERPSRSPDGPPPVGTDDGCDERIAACPSGDARRPGGLATRVDDDILVVSYLSAVAAELEERGIAVITLRRDWQHPDVLSGTLTLHPSTACARYGWGTTHARWRQDAGWSVEFCGGINGHVSARHCLCSEPIPSPGAVAGFVAAVAACRDIGASAPPQFAGNHQELVTQLYRFRPERGRGQRDPALPPAARTTIDDLGQGDQAASRSGAMPLPVLIPHQRQAALAKAALARTARRQLREQITRGELGIAAVLDRARTDPVVARTRVIDLLTALPGCGWVTVTTLLRDTRIHPARRVAGLGRRQRQALLDALTPESPRADGPMQSEPPTSSNVCTGRPRTGPQ
jgi:hypothetical protein